MIQGVHHVSISTRSIDRMLTFYRDLLELPQVLDHTIADSRAFDTVVGLKGSRARCVMLQAGNTFIEFWEYASPQGRAPIAERPVCDAGLTHLCFDVDDARAEYERLARAGVRFESEPQDMGTVVTSYARDPDGNLVEIRQGRPGSVVAMSPAVLEASRSTLGRN